MNSVFQLECVETECSLVECRVMQLGTKLRQMYSTQHNTYNRHDLELLVKRTLSMDEVG